MNKAGHFLLVFLTVFLAAFGVAGVNAASQFRIDVLPQGSKVVLQGKPSETVGVTAFMQEGLDYLKTQKVVYLVSENITWQNFLRRNGVRLRPGSDRYALRSDRYYRFFHINISAIKPRQQNAMIPWKLFKNVLVAGSLVILTAGALVYLFRPLKSKPKLKRKMNRKLKPKLKRKMKVKTKNVSKSISLTKKITRKKVKKQKVKKAAKKIITQKPVQKKKTRVNVKKKVTKKKTIPAPVVYRKSKSILIKPTAKRIKNIKLARQMAKKSLTLDDFIQEDLANSPSGVLKQPTKTALRANSPDL